MLSSSLFVLVCVEFGVGLHYVQSNNCYLKKFGEKMSVVKVMVTTDGSNLSEKAIDTAVELSTQLGAELIGMTTVVGPAPVGGYDHEDAAIRDRLSAISRKATEKGIKCELVAEHSDAVWKGILECAARNNVSFIVMASRGLGSIGSLLLGSETQKVLHQADRPVLIVR